MNDTLVLQDISYKMSIFKGAVASQSGSSADFWTWFMYFQDIGYQHPHGGPGGPGGQNASSWGAGGSNAGLSSGELVAAILVPTVVVGAVAVAAWALWRLRSSKSDIFGRVRGHPGWGDGWGAGVWRVLWGGLMG